MSEFAEELASALFAAIASAIALTIGWKKGFFQLPPAPEESRRCPTLLLVLIALAIYLAVLFLFNTLYSKGFFSAETQEGQVKMATLISFFNSLSIFTFLFLFIRTISKPIRKAIFLESERFEPQKDLLAAIGAWLISYPLVLFISSSFDLLFYFIYGTFNFPDQLAVLLLKMTFEKPALLIMSLISTVLFAPLIEETLFRGFLQGWLRRYLAPTYSIVLSSALFTSFHYSASQGASNFSILSSLFVLGCFLGFLYERRRSLFSPILLHTLFNSISAINIYISSVL